MTEKPPAAAQRRELAANARIDLHAHSSVSDGTESPDALVRQAAATGLDVVAITDHDTVEGWPAATRAARQVGIGLIPGIELSTRAGRFSVHLLAYLPDPEHPALATELARIRAARSSRTQQIVERVNVDYPLAWEDVQAHRTGEASLGRPHIADALVTRGHAVDRYDAFERILHPRHGYLVPLYAPSTVEGVRLVRAAGGVPVLAHPATQGRGWVIPEARLRELRDAGLFGLEIDHPENTEDGKARLRELAAELGLQITGGSDWHGAGKRNQLGEQCTAPEVLSRLLSEARGVSPVGF